MKKLQTYKMTWWFTLVLFIQSVKGRQGWVGGVIDMKIINPDSVFTPFAPYSQAVQVDSILNVSPQTGLNKTASKVEGGIVEETKQALDNLGEILKAAGSDYSKVVKVDAYLADINDYAAFNEVYKQYFTSNFPARNVYEVTRFPKVFAVEIGAIAVVGDVKNY